MSDSIALLLGLLVGAVGGLVIGWLWCLRRNSSPPGGRNAALEDELRGQLARLGDQAAQLRVDLDAASKARASAEASLAANEAVLVDQRAMHSRVLEASELAQQKGLKELQEAFKALSAEALIQSQPQFLQLATQTFERFQETARCDLEQRQQAIASLMEPLKQQLETYQKSLQATEATQNTTHGELRKHLESLTQQSHVLSTETLQLRRVLSSNQARGRWGEETLRRVVEAAGMSAHCDFSEQAQSGDSKPDLVVHLPGERAIIVDAKVPDLDFLTALDTADPRRRAEALAEHAAKLKGTIKALADRNYPAQFPNALDYVVLFVPAESLFSAALEGDQDLMIWAQNKRILIATPSSLIAILRSVSLSWQQQAQTDNARAITAAAQELFLRVAVFVGHFDRIRAGLERACQSYNDAVGSFERQVRPSGERLKKLGAGTEGKPLPELDETGCVLRSPPESTAPGDPGLRDSF